LRGISAGPIKRLERENGNLVDERVALTKCVNELRPYPPRLIIVDELNNLYGQFANIETGIV
jgi:hypothetical protein